MLRHATGEMFFSLRTHALVFDRRLSYKIHTKALCGDLEEYL
jgi:hypothetical protein